MIKEEIKDPLRFYLLGLKNAVLSIEKNDDNYPLEKICDATSRYLLEKKDYRENKPMIVGIGASKGGVGKSTVAINLGHAFARAGLKVGVVDTDLADPNDALYIYQDTNDLRLGRNENVVFDNKGNLVDVLFGRKVDGKRSLQRKPFTEIGRQSKTKPNLTYFLLEQLGDSYGERGNSAMVIQTVQNILLKESKKLKDYDVVILDFPAGTPEHLSAYIGCDERGYVVDFGNRASFSGIYNISRLVAKKKIDGNNFLFINRIPQFANRQKLQDAFAKISNTLERFVQSFGEDYYMRQAQRIVPTTNEFLKQLNLEKLAFDSRPAFLRGLKDVEKSTDYGMPYLASLTKTEERSFGYSREMFTLAMGMFDSYLKKISTNNLPKNLEGRTT